MSKNKKKMKKQHVFCGLKFIKRQELLYLDVTVSKFRDFLYFISSRYLYPASYSCDVSLSHMKSVFKC